MTRPIRDPERVALKYFLKTCTLSNKRVLEIGCGDGVFTRLYARRAQEVIGIDPVSSEVKIALDKARAIKDRKSIFSTAKGEQLPFGAGSFDIALFALSL